MVVVAVAVDEADVLRTTAEEDEGANATAEPMRVERTASFMLVLLMIGGRYVYRRRTDEILHFNCGLYLIINILGPLDPANPKVRENTTIDPNCVRTRR
jgi:hypothetical protein